MTLTETFVKEQKTLTKSKDRILIPELVKKKMELNKTL